MVSTPALTPVTIPPDTAADELLALQIPAPVASVKVTDDPTHTNDGPEIVPALSSGPMVTTSVAETVPQALVTEYLMVSVPGIMPVINPVAVIVALLFVALHVPPAVVSTRNVNVPAQIVERPTMVPGFGARPTEITLVAVAVPQVLVTA